MKSFDFTLILAGHPAMTEDVAEALFEAGCDDGTPGESCGQSLIHFTRAAESLDAALRSAIAQVTSVGLQVARMEMEMDAFVAGAKG